jgi:hypothetical protein
LSTRGLSLVGLVGDFFLPWLTFFFFFFFFFFFGCIDLCLLFLLLIEGLVLALVAFWWVVLSLFYVLA